MPFITVLEKSIYYDQSSDFQADRPTLLFVHGAGGSSKNWDYQLAGIKGYNLIALDLPGHGRSEGSAADSIITYRDFVWCFVQALELGQFVIAGHSMGGAIALELSFAYPKALKGLIIIDSGARLRVNPSVLEVLSRGEPPLESVKYSYSFNASVDFLAKATEEMKKMDTEVYFADLRACNEFNIMDRIRSIITPALVICGQDDQMTPLKYSRYLYNELPQATMALITDAGHMAMLEQPDQVNKAINDYLAQTMIKTISAYVNVALTDYDDSMLNHVVELMKESLRESNELILEDTWKVEETKRKLVRNEEGVWETQSYDSTLSKLNDTREILEVMTVGITADMLVPE